MNLLIGTVVGTVACVAAWLGVSWGLRRLARWFADND